MIPTKSSFESRSFSSAPSSNTPISEESAAASSSSSGRKCLVRFQQTICIHLLCCQIPWINLTHTDSKDGMELLLYNTLINFEQCVLRLRWSSAYCIIRREFWSRDWQPMSWSVPRAVGMSTRHHHPRSVDPYDQIKSKFILRGVRVKVLSIKYWGQY